MAVNSVRFVFILVCFLASYTQAQEPAAEPKAIVLTEQSISRTCFGCICEAASGCNTTAGCNGDVCGPFRITMVYWSDGGKPTINNEANTAFGAFPRCVDDLYCATQTIQGYMNRYAQDCNGDGVINCDDYVRLHRLGSSGCSGTLDPKYENVYKTCVRTFGN